MTSKIFRSTIFVAVVVLLCSLSVVMGVMYNHFSNVQVNQLKDELSLAVTGTEQYGNAFLENVEADRFRVTWINADGTVLYDTQADETTMENHADRQEFQDALRDGSGSSIRTSSTLTGRTLYEARRLQDGTVLRISTSQASAWTLMIGMLEPIALVAVLAIVLSAFWARRMANRIVEPLNSLDLEHPLENDIYEEITPLLRRINQQHLQISAQLHTLKQKTDEFDQITGNMQEGLVLLDGEATILSINPTAKRLFATGEHCVGKNFLSVETSQEMRTAVNGALDHGHGSFRGRRNGRDWQLDLNRIESEGAVVGAVVLAVDVTEALHAEQNRREFSANVSHELKTPLQSIMGSAELLESGLVKPEDTQRFIGHIRREAARLVNLIEDIIRLSQLDEGAALPMEDVDLYRLAQEAAALLQPTAAQKQVCLTVEGRNCMIRGVRRLLHEMVFNLGENAVKYNVPGGQVRILVQDRVLTVSDTGIGIPAEHQERVFERFYRVDKSHSKQSGGTGLGLSIVKHAAQHHHASLELSSTPGIGTTITVTF